MWLWHQSNGDIVALAAGGGSAGEAPCALKAWQGGTWGCPQRLAVLGWDNPRLRLGP